MHKWYFKNVLIFISSAEKTLYDEGHYVTQPIIKSDRQAYRPTKECLAFSSN